MQCRIIMSFFVKESTNNADETEPVLNFSTAASFSNEVVMTNINVGDYS